MDNLLPVFHTSCDIFFLPTVIFSHVLHLDVLRRQIELKLKVKTEISLCMAIMQNNPLPSLYIHSTTVLCDTCTVYMYTVCTHVVFTYYKLASVGKIFT